MLRTIVQPSAKPVAFLTALNSIFTTPNPALNPNWGCAPGG